LGPINSETGGVSGIANRSEGDEGIPPTGSSTINDLYSTNQISATQVNALQQSRQNDPYASPPLPPPPPTTAERVGQMVTADGHIVRVQPPKKDNEEEEPLNTNGDHSDSGHDASITRGTAFPCNPTTKVIKYIISGLERIRTNINKSFPRLLKTSNRTGSTPTNFDPASLRQPRKPTTGARNQENAESDSESEYSQTITESKSHIAFSDANIPFDGSRRIRNKLPVQASSLSDTTTLLPPDSTEEKGQPKSFKGSSINSEEKSSLSVESASKSPTTEGVSKINEVYPGLQDPEFVKDAAAARRYLKLTDIPSTAPSSSYQDLSKTLLGAAGPPSPSLRNKAFMQQHR
jgi:hypothetical protein